MQRAQVLIVDDDPNMLLLMKYNLEKRGYAVSTASDGASGLRTALHGEFDLFLLDVMLPGLSGLDLCRRLRSEVRYQETPILLVTARGQKGDLDAVAEYGASAYVTKPFDPIRLTETVGAYLTARREASLRPSGSTTEREAGQ